MSLHFNAAAAAQGLSGRPACTSMPRRPFSSPAPAAGASRTGGARAVRAPVTPRPNSPSGEREESGGSQGGGGGDRGSGGDSGSSRGDGGSGGGPAVNAVVLPARLNDLVLQLTMQQLWLLVGSIWAAPLAASLWALDKLATKEDLRGVKEDLREVKKEQGEMKKELQGISRKLDKVYGDAAVAKGFTMGTGMSALIVAAVWLLHRQR